MDLDSSMASASSNDSNSQSRRECKRDNQNDSASSTGSDSDTNRSPGQRRIVAASAARLPFVSSLSSSFSAPVKPPPPVIKPLFQLLGSYKASRYIPRLVVLRGSVVDFGGTPNFDRVPRTAAIVNAANEGCLGGGGVDGAINRAGGQRLDQTRHNLPILGTTEDGRPIRCHTGQAVLTGPNVYQDLRVPYIIHAVGPNYFDYDNEEDTVTKGHPLLRSAYQSSLDIAYEHRIQSVGFSLLSAGIFKGPILTIKQVLEIGLEGIESWKPKDVKEEDKKQKGKSPKKVKNDTDSTTDTEVEETLSCERNDNNNGEKETSMEDDKSSVFSPEVYLCGFTAAECNTLVDLCNEKFEKTVLS